MRIYMRCVFGTGIAGLIKYGNLHWALDLAFVALIYFGAHGWSDK
jgi:hypothetical protein